MSVELSKHIIYVSGLPRSGSTLLCQLIGQHPQVYSTGHSSPLSNTILQLRLQLSDDPFLLSQLDVDFELGYKRLRNAYRGFINGWFHETEQSWVVDKNRSWVGLIDTLSVLDPALHMLVCLRAPDQIYGSIEAQHQKTILLDFPDHLAGHTRHARADQLFGDKGVIGAPLRMIQGLQDVPRARQERLFYVIFEHLMESPQEVVNDIYQWLGLEPHRLDPGRLETRAHESDSYYRFKYPHKTFSEIRPPEKHDIPLRIARDIREHFRWFYELFYPGLL